MVRWVIGVTLVCSALMATLVLCGVLGKQARPQPSVAKPVDPPAPMSAPSATAAMPAGVVPEQDRDATFMRVLDMKHVPHKTLDGPIRYAHAVCAAFNGDIPRTLLEQTFARQHPEITSEDRAFVIDLSIAVYCPELIAR